MLNRCSILSIFWHPPQSAPYGDERSPSWEEVNQADHPARRLNLRIATHLHRRTQILIYRDPYAKYLTEAGQGLETAALILRLADTSSVRVLLNGQRMLIS